MFRGIASPPVLRSARQDAAAIAAAYGFAFLCYGSLFWILLGAIALRALLISLSDNVYHYGTPLGATRFAANLRLPAAFECLYLHFNLHGVHHGEPRLRWFELRGAFSREGGRFEAGFAAALVRQLRGPVPA